METLIFYIFLKKKMKKIIFFFALVVSIVVMSSFETIDGSFLKSVNNSELRPCPNRGPQSIDRCPKCTIVRAKRIGSKKIFYGCCKFNRQVFNCTRVGN